jgi:hypothetical protein
MSELNLDQLKQAYDAALQQIAAESFLQQGMDDQQKIVKLGLGNNREATDPNTIDLPGKLRMTQSQAEAFVSRHQILDSQPNDRQKAGHQFVARNHAQPIFAPKVPRIGHGAVSPKITYI